MDKNGKIYVLKMDIKKFYPSVRHSVYKKAYSKDLKDRDALWLMNTLNYSNIGTGYSNVHLNIEQVDEPETDDMGNIVQEKFVKKWKADVQRVKNPVSYDKTVDAAIKDEFPNGEEEAALRKGILNKLDPDYVKLNEFAESVKQSYLKGYGKQ